MYLPQATILDAVRCLAGPLFQYRRNGMRGGGRENWKGHLPCHGDRLGAARAGEEGWDKMQEDRGEVKRGRGGKEGRRREGTQII